eukprot:TRINITY_DN2237_c0_g1_i5.p1 TRINITY_DN2237_c0_g1~~TRINITY_DN2237_c0_g1_i5.p1  ORF type:complete len:152 (+),score=14.71 TRINITY_DN2237_c0_g1_i5:589-1044(+)
MGTTGMSPIARSCMQLSPAGWSVNLNQLTNNTADIYLVAGERYYINMCRTVVTAGFPADTAIGQIDGRNNYWSCGTLSSIFYYWQSNTVLQLQFTGGGGGRQTKITLSCGTNSGPAFVSESPMLTYNFNWVTPILCAPGTFTTGRTSTGTT